MLSIVISTAYGQSSCDDCPNGYAPFGNEFYSQETFYSPGITLSNVAYEASTLLSVCKSGNLFYYKIKIEGIYPKGYGAVNYVDNQLTTDAIKAVLARSYKNFNFNKTGSSWKVKIILPSCINQSFRGGMPPGPCPDNCCAKEYTLSDDNDGILPDGIKVTNVSNIVSFNGSCAIPSTSFTCYNNCNVDDIMGQYLSNTVKSCPDECYWTLSGNNNITPASYIGTNVNHPLVFKTDNEEPMRIHPDGRIIFGKEDGATKLNAEYKFGFKGKVVAEEVAVFTYPSANTSWPDYVFDSNYKLKDLEQLEQEIEENKHLPEVPTASDVEANGIKLGEMQSILLKKVEELTLYVIQLNKENKALKAEVNKIKAKAKKGASK